MMAANFTDALLGYEFYLRERGEASMAEVNAYLQRLRRPEISLRTYSHYRKLISHGFRSYVPINKFDVFRSLGKLQMAADRRRYARRNVIIAARLSRDNQHWTDCTIIDISLVGFGIRAVHELSVTPGTQVWVQMDGYDPIPTFVAWARDEEDTTRLGLRAMEFIDHFRHLPEEAHSERPLGLLVIRRDRDDRIDWKHFVHILEVCAELIEATADLLIVIREIADLPLDLPRPTLYSIEFRSPGDGAVKVDLGIAEILKTLFDNLRNWGLYRKRYQAETRRVELDNERVQIEHDHARLENANLQVEVLRNVLNLRAEALTQGIKEHAVQALLHGPLKNALQVTELPADLFGNNSLERGILEERILPAAIELTNGDDPSYEVSAALQEPEESEAPPGGTDQEPT